LDVKFCHTNVVLHLRQYLSPSALPVLPFFGAAPRSLATALPWGRDGSSATPGCGISVSTETPLATVAEARFGLLFVWELLLGTAALEGGGAEDGTRAGGAPVGIFLV
jgi:hypothetical protein